jgi:hypothetical protein
MFGSASEKVGQAPIWHDLFRRLIKTPTLMNATRPALNMQRWNGPHDVPPMSEAGVVTPES